MAKLVLVNILVLLVMYLVVQVYSLNCLRCNSTDVNSSCRFGSRTKHSNRRQKCQGLNATCFVIATVTPYGSAYFQRGCTIEDVCKDRDDAEVEFCRTCKSNFCNYDVMELDQEVDDYLNEVRNYNDSVDPSKKNISNKIREKMYKTKINATIEEMRNALQNSSNGNIVSPTVAETAVVDNFLNQMLTKLGIKTDDSIAHDNLKKADTIVYSKSKTQYVPNNEVKIASKSPVLPNTINDFSNADFKHLSKNPFLFEPKTNHSFINHNSTTEADSDHEIEEVLSDSITHFGSKNKDSSDSSKRFSTGFNMDQVLNDGFAFPEPRSSVIAFADDDVAGDEDLTNFRENDSNEFENFELDARMSGSKPSPKI